MTFIESKEELKNIVNRIKETSGVKRANTNKFVNAFYKNDDETFQKVMDKTQDNQIDKTVLVFNIIDNCDFNTGYDIDEIARYLGLLSNNEFNNKIKDILNEKIIDCGLDDESGNNLFDTAENEKINEYMSSHAVSRNDIKPMSSIDFQVLSNKLINSNLINNFLRIHKLNEEAINEIKELVQNHFSDEIAFDYDTPYNEQIDNFFDQYFDEINNIIKLKDTGFYETFSDTVIDSAKSRIKIINNDSDIHFVIK